MAAERAGLVRPVRRHHRLPARLAARRQGASSRGPHGRIEEHGLHLWLGFYENAFRLLRECYAELDRPTTDPAAPIRTWRDALWPAAHIGIEDRHGDDWDHWLAGKAEADGALLVCSTTATGLLRDDSGHVIGVDMDAALKIGAARGSNLAVLSELLPAAEAGLVEALCADADRPH